MFLDTGHLLGVEKQPGAFTLALKGGLHVPAESVLFVESLSYQTRKEDQITM